MWYYKTFFPAFPTNYIQLYIPFTAPPLLMRNVTVLPSTVLASVMWETGDDGGYPISSFQLRYRLKNESEIEWKTCQPNYISPDKVSCQYCLFSLAQCENTIVCCFFLRCCIHLCRSRTFGSPSQTATAHHGCIALKTWLFNPTTLFALAR